ncbi:MAG: EamA family transporter, partial [Psittacicella sp.]
MNNLTKGIIAIIIASFGYSIMEFMVKLTIAVPVLEQVLFRNTIVIFIALIIILKKKVNILGYKENRLKLLLRSIFGTIGIATSFYSYSHLILSNADIILKTAPFILIILSAVFLKEHTTKIQLFLASLALIGVFLIVHPTSFNKNIIPYIYAIVGAISAAFAYLMLRVIAKSQYKESPYTVILWFGVISTIIFIPSAIIYWKPLSLQDFILLIICGIGGAIGQFGLTLAYYISSAKEISIYAYSGVIFTTI